MTFLTLKDSTYRPAERVLSRSPQHPGSVDRGPVMVCQRFSGVPTPLRDGMSVVSLTGNSAVAIDIPNTGDSQRAAQ
jgi:hypothetical protein